MFHYSGHGSQVRDSEGDELDDGKDEVICPFDFNWTDGFIKDDDLASLVGGVKKGVRLEIILDSCHSGTGTRELILDRRALAARPPEGLTAASLWNSPHCIRPRFLAPPPDIQLRADEIFGKALALRKIARADPMNHVLWAACRSDQFSADAEIDGKPSGAFTFYFCRHLRDTQGKLSRGQLLKLVRASLKHEGFSQVPQLEGPEGTARPPGSLARRRAATWEPSRKRGSPCRTLDWTMPRIRMAVRIRARSPDGAAGASGRGTATAGRAAYAFATFADSELLETMPLTENSAPAAR